jgi:hypothetical protein
LQTDINKTGVEPSRQVHAETVGVANDRHLKSIDENLSYLANKNKKGEGIRDTPTHTIITKGNVTLNIKK